MLSKVDFLNPQQCEEYENFVSSHQNACFMQALKWAGVKKGWGHEALLVKNQQGKPIASALVLIKKVPLFNTCLFYLPHGPVWDFKDENAFNAVMDEVDELAKEHHAYRCLIDPIIMEDDQEVIQYIRERGLAFKENAKELTTAQPRNSYMLFFNGRNEEEIFAAFHQKWRYNIRVAQRKGVECKICGKEALDDFCMLMRQTGIRDGFSTRNREYFERMLDELGENCRLYMCYHNGVPLSGAVTTQYAGKTCYVYGASSNEKRNLMPNYLMQWTMIQWAIQSGGDVYDFMGIPFYNDETHPNYGVYRFKRGFNGEVVTYAGEFSQVYRPALSVVVDFGVNLRALKQSARRRVQTAR